MKLALIGATGFVGRPILTEALSRPELAVTALVRNPAGLPAHERLRAVSCDARDPAALTAALEQPLEPGKPSCVIARTTKGKGVSFMEDVGKWHHGVPNDDEYTRALAELDQAIARLTDPRP